MTPLNVTLLLVISFSTLMTVHVLGSVALAARGPRWSALLALVVPPAFPYFALRRHATGWLLVWSASVVVYVTALAIASGRS